MSLVSYSAFRFLASEIGLSDWFLWSRWETCLSNIFPCVCQRVTEFGNCVIVCYIYKVLFCLNFIVVDIISFGMEASKFSTPPSTRSNLKNAYRFFFNFELSWPTIEDCWFAHEQLLYDTSTVLRNIVGLGLYLPGQDPSSQGLLPTGSPVHCLPPALGAGLLHCLLLMLVPGPHDLLHALQSLQAPQPPSTAKGTENRSVPIRLPKLLSLLRNTMNEKFTFFSTRLVLSEVTSDNYHTLISDITPFAKI